jgi:hypothetical protein
MARFNWKYGTLAVAEASRSPVTCSAGANQKQEYISPIELTGTAGGGSDGATFGYEWMLTDPEGNSRDYWITGSNLSSMSFNPGNFPFAGNWVGTLIVSSSDPDDAIQSSSATVTIGSSSWIRFNPNYNIDNHYSGSSNSNGPAGNPIYYDLVWADSGTFTEVTASVPSQDANNMYEWSIQWFDTTLPIAGSSSAIPSGTIRSIDWKIIFDPDNMLTSSDEFYAGWIVGNPQVEDSFTNQQWTAAGIDFAAGLLYFGGPGESSTQKYLLTKAPGTTTLSWASGAGANGSTSGVGSFLFDMVQDRDTTYFDRPKFDEIRLTRVSQSVAEANASTAANLELVQTSSIMKLGACIARGDGGLTLTASLRAKWFYRINRNGDHKPDGIF